MDHYQNPQNKRKPKNNNYSSFHLASDNCIDDIVVYVLCDNDNIVDCCFTGVACTISTAATDIMCGLVVGKSKDQAKNLIKQYYQMIHEEKFDEELLDEAIVFKNTVRQAARIKCATIGWDALSEILEGHHE